MDLGKPVGPVKVREPIIAPDYKPMAVPERETVKVGR